MKFKDYYETLQVPRDAAAEQIKRAYRRLAKEHHPDLHPEKDKAGQTKHFQAINEAYEVLGDRENRAKYDRLGENWKSGDEFAPPPGQSSESQGFSPGSEAGGAAAFSDFFRSFFGGAGGARSGFQWESAQPSRDIEAVLDLSLQDAVRGGEKAFSLVAAGLCGACRGTGRRGKSFCPVCGGAGEVRERKDIRVRIPPQVRDGTRIRVKGKGSDGRPGEPSGDLYLRIGLRPDPRFTIQGSDLETIVKVMPWDAALGGEVDIQTLEGPVRVKIPKGSTAGKTLRLAGKGLGRKSGDRGDLLARIEIEMPRSLTPKAEALFKELREELDDKARGG